MPPNSKVFLRAYCNQKLMIEDFSYVFQLPVGYVPSYLGNQIKVHETKVIQEENKNELEPEDFDSTVEIR